MVGFILKPNLNHTRICNVDIKKRLRILFAYTQATLDGAVIPSDIALVPLCPIRPCLV